MNKRGKNNPWKLAVSLLLLAVLVYALTTTKLPEQSCLSEAHYVGQLSRPEAVGMQAYGLMHLPSGSLLLDLESYAEISELEQGQLVTFIVCRSHGMRIVRRVILPE